MSNRTINVKTKSKVWNLNPGDILYVESRKHDITIYTREDEYVCRMKLCDFLDGLPDCFIRLHQSYAINAGYVKSFDAYGATLLDGRTIPISRRRRKEAEGKWKRFVGTNEKKYDIIGTNRDNMLAY